LWSATTADNASACGQAGSWTTINEFIHTRCMELKEEWQAK